MRLAGANKLVLSTDVYGAIGIGFLYLDAGV